MKLIELLNMKDSKYRIPVTIGLNDTVFMAVQKLAEHDRGSLPVCDEKGELKGIITERDIARKCFSKSGESIRIRIKNIMSTEVAVGQPNDDLNYALNVMKQKRIRHLPIVDKKKVIGMISMRDLLGIQLEESDTKVRFLSDYISGGSQS
ncbi:CBS domain-containing protein [Chloroflexota bacterium]